MTRYSATRHSTTRPATRALLLTLLVAGAALGPPPASRAQDAPAEAAPTTEERGAACSDYEVSARLLNVRAEPNVFGSIIDVLRQGERVCVTREESSGGQRWGFVASKGPAGGDAQSVEGWTSLRYLEAAAPAAAPPVAEAPTAPAPAPTAPVPTAPVPTAPAAPTPVAGDGLTFTDPVPYGAFPVRGRSLQQLAGSIPLFAPFEGLPEDQWKKQCTGCHQWNRDRLCEQAKSYADNPAAILRISHPYGGPYKKALSDWHEGGCQ